jgi:hypothetical protein
LVIGGVSRSHALVVNGYTNYLNLLVVEYSRTPDFTDFARLCLSTSTTRIIFPCDVFARIFFQQGQAQILQQETVQCWIEEVRHASNEVER